MCVCMNMSSSGTSSVVPLLQQLLFCPLLQSLLFCPSSSVLAILSLFLNNCYLSLFFSPCYSVPLLQSLLFCPSSFYVYDFILSSDILPAFLRYFLKVTVHSLKVSISVVVFFSGYTSFTLSLSFSPVLMFRSNASSCSSTAVLFLLVQ